MQGSEQKESVQVLFPCVHGLAHGQLVTINCFPVAELRSSIKVVSGVDEEIARGIIGASRFHESGSQTAMGVMALFSNPLFSGASYGLALALADKIVRYGMAKSWRAVYATGAVPPDGCGQVETVGGFPEKLDILCQSAVPESIFVYPAKNARGSVSIREKLEQLQNMGVRCLPVSQIDDAAGRVWNNGMGANDRSGKRRVQTLLTVPRVSGPVSSLRFYRIFFSLILVCITCFLIYFSVIPIPAVWDNKTNESRSYQAATEPGFHIKPGEDHAVVGKNFAQEKKRIIFEPDRKISHQVMRQEKNSTDQGMTIAGTSSTSAQHDQDYEEAKVMPVLESEDIDSSAY